MQNEMIERVKRAISSHHVSRFHREDGSIQAWVVYNALQRVVASFPAHEMAKADAACSELNARAAIEAMREPTAAMVEAGADNNHGGRYTCLPAWQAMIDAALTPP